MGNFIEPFDSLAAWTMGAGAAGNFVLGVGTPAPYLGASRASTSQNDVDFWAAARFDTTDNNIPGNTYWMSLAFYLPQWSTLWAGGANNNAAIVIAGFSTSLSDPEDWITQTNNQALISFGIKPQSAGTGSLDIFSSGDTVIASFTGEDQWHTARFGLRLDGANSRQTLYIDGNLEWDQAVDYSGIGAWMENGASGVMVTTTLAAPVEVTIPIDSLVWDPNSDPGEPTETAGVSCTGQGLLMRVELDEVDVTDVCVRGAWTPRLNRPAQATVTIPMELAGGDAGSRLKFYLVDGSSEVLVFHGLVLNIETTADKDTGYTQYNAQDPMELWQWRPVRDDGADFSKPDIITAYQSGPQILEAMLINTVDSTGRVNTEGETGGPPPTDAEGPIFLTPVAFDVGGPDLSGAPTDWPMTIMELFTLLVSTGQLDAVITPIELGANDEMGEISGYNGNYGQDLSTDVLFSYGMGARNVSGLRWNRDMTNMVNKYWIYGGPRMSTAADPAGDQHWCFNVTGFSTLPAPPGGQAVDTSNNPVGPPWTNNQLGEQIYNSRVSSAGVRMKVDIFDAYDDNCMSGVNAAAHELYKYQWQTYSWFSAIPRDLIHVTPVPDVYIGCFGIGDLVGIEASSEVRGGFSGAQRVYEYTVSWEGTASVLTLSELQVSSDAEGLFN